MINPRQTVNECLIRFHVIRDCDRRCGYLLTNGICRQYTSVISGKRMLSHIPQRQDNRNYGSRLEQRNKATDQRQAFCFYHHRLYLRQNTRVKVFAQPYLLLILLLNEQVLITEQMSRNLFF